MHNLTRVCFLLGLLAETGCGSGRAYNQTPTLDIRTVAPLNGASEWFDRSIDVFGIELYAAPETPDEALRHAAAVAAEYLDNDEDGIADDPLITASLSATRATVVMFASQGSFEAELLEAGWFADRLVQDLAADETNPETGFDASLEEILHLIHQGGHVPIYAELFDPDLASFLTEAMDIARGGQFTSPPDAYPEGAWFTYDDQTCDYACMSIEYAFWAQTSLLGAHTERCEQIAPEWTLCEPDQMRAIDLNGTALFEDRLHKPLSVLPDGTYAAAR